MGIATVLAHAKGWRAPTVEYVGALCRSALRSLLVWGWGRRCEWRGTLPSSDIRTALLGPAWVQSLQTPTTNGRRRCQAITHHKTARRQRTNAQSSKPQAALIILTASRRQEGAEGAAQTHPHAGPSPTRSHPPSCSSRGVRVLSRLVLSWSSPALSPALPPSLPPPAHADPMSTGRPLAPADTQLRRGRRRCVCVCSDRPGGCFRQSESHRRPRDVDGLQPLRCFCFQIQGSSALSGPARTVCRGS